MIVRKKFLKIKGKIHELEEMNDKKEKQPKGDTMPPTFDIDMPTYR